MSSITFLLWFLHTNLTLLSQITSHQYCSLSVSVWWNKYLWQQFFRRVSMTVLQRLLGSKDFHLTSIILASSGITMHLWMCLPHSAGKKLCMTMLWFCLLLTKYCILWEHHCPASSNLDFEERQILAGKTGKVCWKTGITENRLRYRTKRI